MAVIMLKLIFKILSILLCLPGLVMACQPLQALPGDWQEHRLGDFVFQYSLSGKHALRNQSDSVGTGLPDVVSDAKTQILAARELLNQLGFQFPLNSRRYRTFGVEKIFVQFRSLEGKLNGRSISTPYRLPSGECVLVIYISNKYETGNYTPIHELFHQVQNGYTMLMQNWFYEGLARWSRTIMDDNSVSPDSVPDTEAALQDLWGKSYRAVNAWYGLFLHCDLSSGQVQMPEKLRELRYRNGKRVVRDNLVPGHFFVLRVLQELDALSLEISAQEQLDPYQWPKIKKRDKRYDRAIWQAVMRVCQQPM